MYRLRLWLDRLRTSLWFVPGLIVLASVLLAFAVLRIDAALPKTWWEDAPGLAALFDVRIGGAMATLQAIGTSIMTIAGVVFSITIAAMTLASGQYTSRVLRNFIRDRANQAVLGIFLGIFVYCMLVMRSLSGVNENSHAPPVALLLSLVLAFVGIAMLIYFIHHIAMSLQATRVVATIAETALPSIDRHFPDRFEPPDESETERSNPPDNHRAVLRSKRNGYVTGVDTDTLLSQAEKEDCLVRVWRSPGQFVTEGETLAEIRSAEALDDESLSTFCNAWSFSTERTLENDPGYGLRQLVDVALKALSPGVNETTTGVMCVNWIGVILVRMSGRRMPPRTRSSDKCLRVVTNAPGLSDFIRLGFVQIRQNASGNVAVLKRQLEVLLTLATGAGARVCREAITEQADAIESMLDPGIPWPPDRQDLENLLEAVRDAVDRDNPKADNDEKGSTDP